MSEHPSSAALSVIVPVHEGADFLARSLPAIAASSARDFECIVVDDGSSEALRLPLDDDRFRILRLDVKGGPARARNHGAASARAAVLVFFDADVLVHADTLELLRDRLVKESELAAVIGSYDDQPTDPGFVSQFKNLFHHYVHQHSRREARTFWSGCGAIRRANFHEIGGFDALFEEPSVEDIELGYRLRASGARIALDPAIQVTHLKRWTLASMVRTDVMARAIPWLLLMMRSRTMPADLNAAVSHRLSVALVWLLGACAAATPFAPRTISAAAVVCAGVLLAVNADLYGFFARARGVSFAIRAVALHWLYYAYCGVAVGAAAAIHLGARIRRSDEHGIGDRRQA